MISIGGYNQTVIYRQALKVAPIAMTTSSSSTSIITSPPTRTLSISNRSRPMKRRQGAPKQTQNNNDKELPSSSSSSSSSNSYRHYISKMSTVSKLNTSTKIEAIVGILLLVAVAVLVNTGLPASEFQNQQQIIQQKIQAEAQTLSSKNIKYNTFTSTKFVENGTRIKLSIDPFTPGNNNFKISFLESRQKSFRYKVCEIETNPNRTRYRSN